MKKIAAILFVLSNITIYAQPPSLEIGKIFSARQTPVHDPVMIKQGNTYYLFCTGFGISVFSSNDLKNWKREKPVFNDAPQWAVNVIPGFKGHIWAPDISFHNGQYYLYYSVSAFGKNTSAIGVATNKTLNPASPDFKWIDHGKLIQSVPGRDMWNAIDPNLIKDENNASWLVFGSFWNGMKLVKLNNSLTAVAQPEEWYTVSARKRDFILPDSVAGDAAIEAPFIFKKGKYYYQFVSWDYCCRAEKSTYKVVVGRSEKVYGPYLDKDGVSMNLGGGSLLIEGNKDWFGAGHSSAYTFDGTDYLIFHGYDAADKGKSKLRIEKLTWLNDWPGIIKQPQ
ncbi:MAG TPA: arabinan endo-1,5-alpha-L-arabinosidase [Segetibacter sp.]|nr:arabinan endo-1,5-alpha-L-arabinosidase [Segetibacter sp.]